MGIRSCLLSCRGYTLLELMVVIAIMGFVAVTSFYGLRTLNKTDQTAEAQKQILGNLRAVQNEVLAGSNSGVTRSATFLNGARTSYAIDGVTYPLPAGVAVTALADTIVCFNNPNATTSTCCGGAGYACPNRPATLTVSGTGPSRTIIIEGNGLFITRIYEP